MAPYPRRRFFPGYGAPPSWVLDLIAVFAAQRGAIDSSVVHEPRMESDDVLRAVARGLVDDLGFAVERGKAKMGKLQRPVNFGDEGSYLTKNV